MFYQFFANKTSPGNGVKYVIEVMAFLRTNLGNSIADTGVLLMMHVKRAVRPIDILASHQLPA